MAVQDHPQQQKQISFFFPNSNTLQNLSPNQTNGISLGDKINQVITIIIFLLKHTLQKVVLELQRNYAPNKMMDI